MQNLKNGEINMSNGISDINEYKKILSSIKNEYVIELSRCLDNLKKFCFEFKELNSRLFYGNFLSNQYNGRLKSPLHKYPNWNKLPQRLSLIGQKGQLGTVPKWGIVGAILIACQNGTKKEGADAPSNKEFSEDTVSRWKLQTY